MTIQEVSFRITIEKPFPGTCYGLQKGSGHSYETVFRQFPNGANLVFSFAIPVKQGKDGRPALHGPFVQGPPQGRFLYLDAGSYAGQQDAPCSGRLKIPLLGLEPDLIVQAGTGRVFTCSVAGTGRDGRAALGTVKPFEGWKLR